MKSLKGTVISNKMKQTVVVAVAYTVVHPKYKKIMKRTTKLLAHNELENVNIGDLVKIAQSRPYSKNVHFIVKEVISLVKPEKKEVKIKKAKKI